MYEILLLFIQLISAGEAWEKMYMFETDKKLHSRSTELKWTSNYG